MVCIVVGCVLLSCLLFVVCGGLYALLLGVTCCRVFSCFYRRVSFAGRRWGCLLFVVVVLLVVGCSLLLVSLLIVALFVVVVAC